MAVRITYFVHGASDDNERGLATGWQDCELSEIGRQQAKDLGIRVRATKFDAVFSSDLKTAVESAELGFSDRYNVQQDRRLRECNYGDLTGTPTSAFEEKLADYIKVPFPRGESFMDVEARISDFLINLKRDYDAMLVAVISHQAPQLALDVLLKGMTWEQAIAGDWRRTGAWQPGWEYVLE
jgi:broad specificity phosphatase PhoE